MYQKIRRPIVISMAILFHLLLIFHLLFSPVIIVFASFKGIINASFFVFIILFLLSLFFGRAYCAWFCPGCGVQEVIAIFIKRKSENSRAVLIKYIIFAVWAGSIITGYILNGIHTVDFSYGMSDVPVTRKIMLTIGAVLIIVPLTAVFGRYASCKYICWQVPLMIAGTKIRDFFRLRGLRLVADSGKCKSCRSCNFKCPMNIDVMENVKQADMNHTECFLCGNCVESCLHKAIRFAWEPVKK
jgi:ferredoxin-type protein NapH